MFGCCSIVLGGEICAFDSSYLPAAPSQTRFNSSLAVDEVCSLFLLMYTFGPHTSANPNPSFFRQKPPPSSPLSSTKLLHSPYELLLPSPYAPFSYLPLLTFSLRPLSSSPRLAFSSPPLLSASSLYTLLPPPPTVRAGGAFRGDELFAFLPRYPALLRSQGIGFSLIGLVLQFADALIFVFLVSGTDSDPF
jgi:hypothetical protein